MQLVILQRLLGYFRFALLATGALCGAAVTGGGQQNETLCVRSRNAERGIDCENVCWLVLKNETVE